MADNPEFCVVFTTISSDREADVLAAALVQAKLAACVQIIKIISHYSWQDVLHCENEYLLIIKTRRVCYQEIEKYIQENHPYETPELILLPIETGLESYLNWIKEQTG